MAASVEIASDALRTGAPFAVTSPAAIAAWARARLSNKPRDTNRRSARSLVIGCLYTTSCPALCRASTSYVVAAKDVDGRDEPGHDDKEILLGELLPRQLHHVAAQILAERFEGLGDDAFGVEA